jgi:hypothetical protein
MQSLRQRVATKSSRAYINSLPRWRSLLETKEGADLRPTEAWLWCDTQPVRYYLPPEPIRWSDYDRRQRFGG